MDQLELLKKDWKRQETDLPSLTGEQLSSMIHKKSSSIVKWIFIVSVLEFCVPLMFYLFFDTDKLNEEYEHLRMTTFNHVINFVVYGIAAVFLILFFINYRKISSTSNTKELMNSIIRTRRTVKYYIWISLSLIPIMVFFTAYKMLQAPEYQSSLGDSNMITVWIIISLIAIGLVGMGWLFYRVMYGILLNKLKANYRDLIQERDMI